MIRLDEKDHSYWAGDPLGKYIRVPGYSEIVKDLGIVRDNPHWTEQGREMGTALHLYLLFLAQGKKLSTEPDPRIAGKVKGIQKFLENSGFKLAFGEVPQYDPTLRFACTPDLVGHLGSFSVNIDCKAGASQKSHVLQLAAQNIALAAGGFRVQKSFVLYLKDDDFRLVEQDTRIHEPRWRSIVQTYHIKQEYL